MEALRVREERENLPYLQSSAYTPWQAPFTKRLTQYSCTLYACWWWPLDSQNDEECRSDPDWTHHVAPSPCYEPRLCGNPILLCAHSPSRDGGVAAVDDIDAVDRRTTMCSGCG